jgi:hypothetical protein
MDHHQCKNHHKKVRILGELTTSNTVRPQRLLKKELPPSSREIIRLHLKRKPKKKKVCPKISDTDVLKQNEETVIRHMHTRG